MGSPIDELRAPCFDVLSRMDDRQIGIACGCGPGSSGCAFEIAAGHKPGARTHRILSYGWLPNVSVATSRQDETNATCGIQIIPSLGDPSGGQGARQAAQRQGSKHLQGMLILGLACRMANTFPKAQCSMVCAPALV